MTIRVVLWGDGESPHLVKWARALAPRVELYAASSRAFDAGFDGLVPPGCRLAFGHDVRFSGGNLGLLRALPRFTSWLRGVDADWIHAHYLTSHGTLAWMARRLGVQAQLAGSAWGSDILVAPERSAAMRWATRHVLQDCAIATSDSQYMTERMKALGAGDVLTFPFGLETMPPEPAKKVKEPYRFFANRGLEPIYDPARVLRVFARVAAAWPEARLAMANDGSLRAGLQAEATSLGLAGRVEFLGRLDAPAQDAQYARARWYLSLPESDSVSVSVIEAMAWGCVPLLSDLPANRELVRDADNGLVLAQDDPEHLVEALAKLAPRADLIARANRLWVRSQAMFGPSVDHFVAHLRHRTPARRLPRAPRPHA
ncbi:MAG TPA: glycosyltransferase [Burkholderiaceae bacterium]|jgi:glycosyltransferase involved in cell wall biosynthesis|nr:glycosyltransferase [Burkholderiaceae bacterium]